MARVYATLTVPPVSPAAEPLHKPIIKIPGGYGLPVIGPIRDRNDYFYNQGKEEFFKSRIQKYKSTVFRVNMPPGPCISNDPCVIALLDGKSFPVLFDVSKVEKKNVFTGTYMPPVDLTGGYRVLSYLDPSESNHAKLKNLLFQLMISTRTRVIPEFHDSYSRMFDSLEADLASNGKAKFNDANDLASLRFLGQAWYGSNPEKSAIGLDGPKIISKWVLFNLGPVLTLGLPRVVEDLALRTFRLPASLIKKDYQKLYDYFYESATPILEEASRMGISKDEACHNLLFATCFNTFGGIKIFFPNILKRIGRAGVNLHRRLAEEVRTAVHETGGGKVTMAALEKMSLVKSVVYETLRIEPPVTAQYGKAKEDLLIESHDAAFEVKRGEMLFGYQPLATKDPRIFDRPEEFVPERFIGEEGERLLSHVMWSNGPETASPTVNDKQCAGKDFAVMVGRLMVAELFLRYDSFEIEVGSSPLGSAVTVTSLKRATS